MPKSSRPCGSRLSARHAATSRFWTPPPRSWTRSLRRATKAGVLGEAQDRIAYSVGRQTQAIYSALRLLPEPRREGARASLEPMARQIVEFGDAQSDRIRVAVAHTGAAVLATAA